MKSLKFAIIGNDNSNTRDLVNEIRKRKHTVNIIALKNIIFKCEKKFKISWKNMPLENFDIFIFRGYSKNLREAKLVAKYLSEKGKTIIDKAIGEKAITGKISEAFSLTKNRLLYPKTFQALSFEEWKKILRKMKFPLIVKPIDGQKGQGIQKFTTKKDALVFFKDNFTGYLLQEFIPLDGDIRIFVVGNSALGAMKRFVIKGDFRSNASLGARATSIPLTKKLKALAISAAQSVDCEIAGVDIFEHKKRLYLFEVNFAPQWEKFKEVTGINPAKYIIDYATKKYIEK